MGNKKNENLAIPILRKMSNETLFRVSENLDEAFMSDETKMILLDIYGFYTEQLRLILSDEIRKEITKRLRALCTTIIPRM